MADKTFQARIKLKKDTAANWESKNPVLLEGEQIFVVTAAGETRVKVGDGVKTYTQLPFTDEPIRTLIGTKTDKTTTITAGNGLTGGGDLSSNRTISHADTSSVSNITANGRKYVTGLTFDDYGHVTGVTTGTETVTNTDSKVTQTVTTSNASYPLLLAPSGQTATATTTSYFDSGVTLNPSTNTIAANISGNAGTATALTTSAGSATQPIYFSDGKPVATTYTLGKSVPSDAKFTDTTYSAATTSTAGLMSAADKSKLDSIATGANKYTLPVAGEAIGGVKSGTDITVDSSGNVSVNNDSHTHSNSTITSLDASKLTGIIPAANLPSYVDDVIEVTNYNALPLTGESGKIYVDLATNLTYRWSGSAYIEVSPGTSVTYSQTLTSGTEIGKITVDGTTTSIYSPTSVANATTATNANKLKITSDASTTSKLPILFSDTTSPTSGNNYAIKYNTNVTVLPSTGVLYGAAWNDYAEYRKFNGDNVEAGRVVTETGKDSVQYTNSRLQFAPAVISDTYGMVIGEDKEGNVPLAIGGKVLAYSYEDRDSYKVGDVLCSGPHGTVSRMTREEIKEYPDRILGYYIGTPKEKEFNGRAINGRIWVRIR